MREGMKYFTDIELPLIALMIFVTVFILTLVVQQKLYSPNKIHRIANLPFEGEAE